MIAGAGPEEASLQQQAARQGLGNVQLLGAVSDEDKMCLLELSLGFVFPSHLRSEAFGMSLVEAAMCEKPMVSCEITTGTSYINLNGVTGLTVPPEDAQALRDAMHKLMDQPELARAMGVAARSRHEAMFTAQHMARAYASVYREVLDARARGRPSLKTN